MSENKRFKVIESKKHDNKMIYELTNNDIGFYNFKEEKLLANMICNELNKRIDEIEQLKKENNNLKQIQQDYEDNVSNWFIENWQSLTDEQRQTAHLELGIELEDLE